MENFLILIIFHGSFHITMVDSFNVCLHQCQAFVMSESHYFDNNDTHHQLASINTILQSSSSHRSQQSLPLEDVSAGRRLAELLHRNQQGSQVTNDNAREECTDDIKDTISNIYYQFMMRIRDVYKPFITRIIFEENYLGKTFTELLNEKLKRHTSNSSKDRIDVIFMSTSNFYSLSRNLISRISNASQKENSLQIVFASELLTNVLLRMRMTRIPNERNDIWYVPQVIVKSMALPSTVFTYSEFTCNKNMIIQEHLFISKIKQWPTKETYSLVLKKGGTVELASSKFGRDNTVIPVAAVKSPPFMFTEEIMDEQDGGVREEEAQRRMVCRERATKEDIHGQPVWTKKYCFGYLVDLLLEIKRELHIDVDLYLVQNAELGGYNSAAGNYTTGLFGDVINNKALIGLGALTITQKRAKYFDFTSSFMSDNINIITLKELAEKGNTKEFNLFTNLDHATQYLILAFYIASILIVYLAENYLQLMRRIFTGDRRYLGVRMFNYASRECVLYITGLLVQRDLGAKCPTTMGGRLISVTFAFGMVCVTTLYTASLTYQQVMHGGYDDFKGLHDDRVQHPTQKFKLASQEQGFLSDILQASNDSMLKRLNRFMKEYNTKTLTTGVQAIMQRDVHAYFMENSFARFHMTNTTQCEVYLHPTNLPVSQYGLVLQKGSALTNQISQVITRLREDGSLCKFHKRWLDRECARTKWKTTDKLSLVFFNKLFTFLLAAVVFSLFLIAIEVLYWKASLIRDTNCMYKQRELQGLLEEDPTLKKWLTRQIPLKKEMGRTRSLKGRSQQNWENVRMLTQENT